MAAELCREDLLARGGQSQAAGGGDNGGQAQEGTTRPVRQGSTWSQSPYLAGLPKENHQK